MNVDIETLLFLSFLWNLSHSLALPIRYSSYNDSVFRHRAFDLMPLVLLSPVYTPWETVFPSQDGDDVMVMRCR